MKLSSAIENYEALKRSLGAVFSVDAGILRSFSRALGDVCLEAITAEDCRTFCRGKGLPTRFWERKHESLRGFFRYLVSRGILINSPFQDPAPRIQRTFRPHIYSHDELRRLLETAAQERNPRTRLEPETLRTIILLLYGAGLRVGEALRLRPCDVNLQDRVLSVWNTKFFKSRLIPIGAGLAAALARYAQQRQPVRPPDEHPPSFFSTRTGMPIQLWQIEVGFARLRKRAGIRRTSTDRWHPRLHDLRATFAVHCLVAWYREGADLQTRLPLLATYLGHVSVSGTQAYLPMTHELLTEASRRFERYAQRRIPMPDSHLLGSFVRRFLLESVIADRNLSRNTQKSYRDAIRLLLRFTAKRYGINPTHLTVEDVTAEVVRNFLTYLEKEQNSQATVNQRLTAIRSLFRFISHCVPELVDLATQVEAVPLRKTVVPTISYLEKKEMDAFLATPDRRRLQGQLKTTWPHLSLRHIAGTV